MTIFPRDTDTFVGSFLLASVLYGSLRSTTDRLQYCERCSRDIAMRDSTDQFYIAVESLNAEKGETFRMECDIYIRKILLCKKVIDYYVQ